MAAPSGSIMPWRCERKSGLGPRYAARATAAATACIPLAYNCALPAVVYYRWYGRQG